MRCLACGAEMQVAEVVRDDTMMVPGYERHTLRCSGCDDVERRLVFNPDGAARGDKPAPAPSAPPAATLSFNSTPPAAAPVEAAPAAPLASATPPPEAPPAEPVTVPAPPPTAAAPPVESEPPVPSSPVVIK